MNRLFLLMTFLCFVSCSVFVGGKKLFIERNLASDVFLDDVVVKSEMNDIKISTSVRVYGQRDGYNSLSLPLEKLESPFYEEVPYQIKIESENIECSHSQNIEKVSAHLYQVKDYAHGDFLNCSSLNEGESFFNITYILPKMKPFEVSEASYMRGFYPDVVNNMEIELAKIYEKLVPPPGKSPQKLYYRERELLLKYVPDIVNLTFDPKKHEVQFKTQIQDQDLLQIGHIEGVMEHPKWGTFSYTGFENEDYIKYKTAGAKYLKPQGVKAFALFCEENKQLHDFEYTNEHTFSAGGHIECSLNSRHQGFFNFFKVKGEVRAELRIMRISKAIQLLPKYYLDQAKGEIVSKINEMNQSNEKRFVKSLKKSIQQHEKKIDEMLIVDGTFPYLKNVNVQIKSTQIIHKAYVRVENVNNKDTTYLNLKIYYQHNYLDKEQKEFQTSEIYVGDLKTRLPLSAPQRLKRYESRYIVGSEDFFEQLMTFYNENIYQNNASVSHNRYEEMLKKMSNKYTKNSRELIPREMKLNRFALSACGKIAPSERGSDAVTQKVTLKELKAHYDMIGAMSPNFWATVVGEKYYTQRVSIETPIEVQTNLRWVSSQDSVEKCYPLTAKDFASGAIENAILLNTP